MSYADLPLDIIHHILEYTGVVKFRHGRYMNQIPQTDERYHIVNSIPRHISCAFNDNSHGLYVRLFMDPEKPLRFINVIVDYERRRIDYSYYNLLYNVRNAKCVCFI